MDFQICLYGSKPCFNPRSIKTNGQLHRLCLVHRGRVNDAQRRWHSRQRGDARPKQSNETTTTSSSSPSPTSSSSLASPSARRRRTRSLEQQRHAAFYAVENPRTDLDGDAGILGLLDDDDTAYLGELLLRLDEANKTTTTVHSTTSTSDAYFIYEPTASNHTGVANHDSWLLGNEYGDLAETWVSYTL